MVANEPAWLKALLIASAVFIVTVLIVLPMAYVFVQALSNGCFWDTHSAPYWSRIYTFECNDPETWQSQQAAATVAHLHSAARAPGAIDALCLMYTTSKYLKESMLPHTGSWTLNEFIPIAGQAAMSYESAKLLVTAMEKLM